MPYLEPVALGQAADVAVGVDEWEAGGGEAAEEAADVLAGVEVGCV